MPWGGSIKSSAKGEVRSAGKSWSGRSVGAWEHGGKGERIAPPTLVIPEITTKSKLSGIQPEKPARRRGDAEGTWKRGRGEEEEWEWEWGLPRPRARDRARTRTRTRILNGVSLRAL